MLMQLAREIGFSTTKVVLRGLKWLSEMYFFEVLKIHFFYDVMHPFRF